MSMKMPKPLHGWRQLLGEVGIIVVGVLIALGAEQLVESLNWRSEAEHARTALRSEVGEDNLPQAYARMAFTPCLLAELDQLDAAFAAHLDRRRFAELAKAYKPPARTWDDEAWKAIMATGVLSRGGSDELIGWSLPYRVIVILGPMSQHESDDVMNLHAISILPGALTPAEADRVTLALERLRTRATSMSQSSQVLIEAARQAGVTMTEAQRQAVLNDLRPRWGSCMTIPRLGKFDIQAQSGAPFQD